MNPQLSLGMTQVRHQELVDQANSHRRSAGGRRSSREGAPAIFWEALTLRLATAADRSALAALAEREHTAPPAAPVLLGVLMARPVAALSLHDGKVIADPRTPTAELIELLRLRARQLSVH